MSAQLSKQPGCFQRGKLEHDSIQDGSSVSGSVGASVGASVGSSVGASVSGSVGASVRVILTFQFELEVFAQNQF